MNDIKSIWESKVARVKDTHCLSDNEARLKAGRMFPTVQAELIGQASRRDKRPGRIAMVQRSLDCDYATAARIVDGRIDACDIRKLHPDDVDDSAMIADYDL